VPEETHFVAAKTLKAILGRAYLERTPTSRVVETQQTALDTSLPGFLGENGSHVPADLLNTPDLGKLRK
jgi:hypothetical protein